MEIPALGPGEDRRVGGARAPEPRAVAQLGEAARTAQRMEENGMRSTSMSRVPSSAVRR
jgi:hypothetical protein